MTFAVSTARVDITPTTMTEMAGYGCVSTPRRATSTYSPLHATAVVLWDDGSPNVLVSVDVGSLPAAWSQALRPRLVALADWASSDIVLFATHTHNAPMAPVSPDPYITYAATDLGPCTAYWAKLADDIVLTVTAALAAVRIPVTLDYQFTTQGWSFNRTGLTYTETDVPILTARKADGLPAVVLFSYGTHPVTAGVQTLWDGDFPSAAAAVVEAAIPGCVAVFLPGPAGDQDPVYPRSWAERNRHGASLGQAVVQKASAPGRTVTGPLVTSLSSITAPLLLPTTPAGWAALRASYVARLTNPPGGIPWAVRHAEKMIAAIDAGTGWATEIVLPTQVWKLSGSPKLRMGFVAGELVSGYGVLFRNRFNGTNGLMICGYANEVQNYTVSDTFFPPYDTNGSYEGGWDTDAPDAAGGAAGVYGLMGHFRCYPQVGALEGLLVTALTTQLT